MWVFFSFNTSTTLLVLNRTLFFGCTKKHALKVLYRTSMVLWKSLFIWVWRGFTLFFIYPPILHLHCRLLNWKDALKKKKSSKTIRKIFNRVWMMKVLFHMQPTITYGVLHQPLISLIKKCNYEISIMSVLSSITQKDIQRVILAHLLFPYHDHYSCSTAF